MFYTSINLRPLDTGVVVFYSALQDRNSIFSITPLRIPLLCFFFVLPAVTSAAALLPPRPFTHAPEFP